MQHGILQEGGVGSYQEMRKKKYNQFLLTKVSTKLVDNKIWWEVVKSCQSWGNVVRKVDKSWRKQ